MSVSKTAGRNDRARSLATKAGEAASWFVPEILSIPRERALRLLSGQVLKELPQKIRLVRLSTIFRLR